MRHILRILALSAATGIPAGASAAPADILAANQAAEGGPAWAGKATLKTAYAYSGQGLTGTTQSLSDLTNGRWVDSFAIGPVTGANGFDGRVAWSKDMSGTVKLEEGGDARQLALALRGERALAVGLGTARADFNGDAVAEQVEVHGILVVLPDAAGRPRPSSSSSVRGARDRRSASSGPNVWSVSAALR